MASYIPRRVKRAKQQIAVRLYEDQLAMLESYARFIDDSRDYIISQALELVFTKDREFAQWLQSAGDTEIRTESIGTRDADSPVNRAGPQAKKKQDGYRGAWQRNEKRACIAGKGVRP